MVSVVEICNSALTRLGASAILALDEDSKAARLCNQHFAGARDAVLRAHPWNCALARALLPRLAEPPGFGFAYQHQLPADCLRAIALDAPDAAFRVEGRQVLSNVPVLRLLYVRRVEDPQTFDPLLVDALAARLAAELAYPIANSHTLAQTFWQHYERKLREARGIDAQEGTPGELHADAWIRARA